MPYCCITKYFLASLTDKEQQNKITHYYDEETQGFMFEYRGRGNGTWYFRYHDMEGKYRYYRIGTIKKISLSDARAKAYTLRQIWMEEGDLKQYTPLKNVSLTLEQFTDSQYLPYARMHKRSWELDRRILRLHVLPYFGSSKLEKICRRNIITWQGDLRSKGLAPGTCNRAHVLVKTLFNCAIRWGILQAGKNPCQGVSLFEDKCKKERYLTPDEARRLIEALQVCHNQQSACAIQLLLYTGARKNEILSARWEYIDFERRLLTVPLSKSGKTRYIPLSDDAVRIFRSIPKGESPWVFPASGGNGHVQSIFTMWHRLRIKLGISDVRIHDLRHSFASFLVNGGRSLYEVQCCLGHCDPKVTMRYAHLNQTVLVQAANTVGKELKKND